MAGPESVLVSEASGLAAKRWLIELRRYSSSEGVDIDRLLRPRSGASDGAPIAHAGHPRDGSGRAGPARSTA